MAFPGERTLVDTLRRTAEQRPEATAIHHIVLDGGQEKSVLLTYADLVDWIDEISRWFHGEVISGKIESFSTIAYLAPNDLRTLLLPLAAAECNLVVLLLSPRNSLDAQAHLVNTNQCSALIVDKVFDHVADHIKSVRQIAAPDFWHIFAKRSRLIGRFSTPSTWDNVCHAGLVKLHTSGSTGLPKSVLITHAVLSTVDIQRNVKNSQDQPCQLAIFGLAERPYTAFPFFHVAGFELACYILFSGSTIVLGPPHQPTSLDIVKTVLKVAKPDALLLPPSILDDIVLEDALLQEVCQAKVLFYGGGQVSQHTGDVLSKKTHLFNGIGGTEVGSICLMPLAPQDWNYFHFVAENGIVWKPVGTASDEYEMVITKNSRYLPYQAVFYSFPELTEWRTKDIFSKHPTEEGLWQYRGRLDDLIVLSTGEKVNPSVIEDVIVSSSPSVKSAIVVGSKRPRPALLVELLESFQTTAFDVTKLRHDIAKSLAGGNSKAISRDSQVFPNDIIIASTDKPFVRTAKGTINRGQTQALYESEIEALYSRSRGNVTVGNWKLNFSTTEALQCSLLKQFRSLLQVEALEVDDNLFYHGLDSRQAQAVALSIRKAISAGLSDESRVDSFKAESIYVNPTILSLSKKILGDDESGPRKVLDQEFEYDQALKASLKDCSTRISQIIHDRKHLNPDRSSSSQHILLTGSTGYVGSWLVQALRCRPEINRITCLDRSNPSRSVSMAKNSSEDNEKGSVLTCRYIAALDQPNLGLSDEKYQDLLCSVTCVVHCQWPVDFNQPLSYFHPNIKGAVNLIQFCLEAVANDCPLLFLSSIATVQRFPTQPVPETHLSSVEYCQTGYGESKSITSDILNHATKEGNLKTVICRLGQVCGPVHEMEQSKVLPHWPSRDWFPTLLRSSKFMHCLPENIGKASRIDWIPVDILSEVLADEIVHQTSANSAKSTGSGSTVTEPIVRQLVNPAVGNYTDLLPMLQQKLGRPDSCKVVKLPTWVKTLEECCLQYLSQNDGPQPPGAELLQFFQELSKTSEHDPVMMETTKTVAALPRLQHLKPIGAAHLEKWLDDWNI